MYAYKGPKLWAIVNKGNHAVALDLKYPGQTCNFLRRGIITILLARDNGLSEILRNDYNNRQELGYKHNRTLYGVSLQFRVEGNILYATPCDSRCTLVCIAEKKYFLLFSSVILSSRIHTDPICTHTEHYPIIL